LHFAVVELDLCIVQLDAPRLGPLLAGGVRRALDMDAVYAAIGLVNPKGDKK